MRFYNTTHQHYCGIEPCRDDLVVGVECLFTTLSILAHRTGRAVYIMLTERQPFDEVRRNEDKLFDIKFASRR